MEQEFDPSRTIRMERTIAAPRELVFEAFTSAAHLDAWWGPDGFTNKTHAMEFSVGGLWHYTMTGPDGKIWPNWIRYTEITPPSRIAYDHGGELGEPAHFKGFILLDEVNGKTRLSLILVFESMQARDATLKFGAREGGRQTLEKLAAYVMKRQG